MNPKFKVLLLIFFISFHVIKAKDESKIRSNAVRKCCETDEYYDMKLQQCTEGGNFKTFMTLVQQRMLNGNKKSLSVVTERLLDCHDGEDCFEVIEITTAMTHSLLPNGRVLERNFGTTLGLGDYCLEVAGNRNPTLAFAFCLPETNIFPKCCPPSHYFDDNTFDCVLFSSENNLGNLALPEFLNLKDDIGVKYQNELQCSSVFPERYNLVTEAYMDECGNICFRQSKDCYSRRKFCLDAAFTTRLEPSAYVCADNATKICCKDEFYEENNIDCKCNSI